MEVKALHSFNDYGINERFLTEAAKYPEYQLARVVAQYRGKYKVATAHGEALARVKCGLIPKNCLRILPLETLS